MTPSESTYQRISEEWAIVDVTRAGQAVPAGQVRLALAPVGQFPKDADWTPAASVEGGCGILVRALAPGDWNIWFNIPGTPVNVKDVAHTITIA